MTVNWTLVDTDTDTGGGFTLTRETHIGTGSSVPTGYLLRVRTLVEYNLDASGNDEPLGLGSVTALAYDNGTVPSNWSWSQVATDNTTEGDYVLTSKSLLGTPLDGSSLPIGGANQPILEQNQYTYQGNPTPGNSLALRFMA